MNQHEQPAHSLLQAQPARRPAGVAFHLGLLFGSLWAALIVLRFLFLQLLFMSLISFLHLPLAIGSLWLASVSFLVFVLLFFGASVLGSKQTGQVTTGIFTAFWIFLWGFVASILTNASSYLFIVSHYPSPLLEDLLHSLFTSNTFTAMVSLIAGAALSALGGVLGRWLWHRQQT